MEKEVPSKRKLTDLESYGFFAVIAVLVMVGLTIALWLTRSAVSAATSPGIPLHVQVVFWLIAAGLCYLTLWITVNMMLIVFGIALKHVEKSAFRLYRLFVLRSKPRFLRITRSFYRRIHTDPAHN